MRVWEKTKAKRKEIMGHERRCKIAFTVTRTEVERSGDRRASMDGDCNPMESNGECR